MEANVHTFRIDKLYESFAASAKEKGRYFFMLDIHHDYARWSPAAVSDFGLPGEYTDSNTRWIREWLLPEEAEAFAEDVKQARRGALDRKETEWHIKTADNKHIACAVKYFTVKDYAGMPSHVGVAITSLVIDAQTDPTTNLPGQIRFLEHLRGLFAKRLRTAVMLIGTMNLDDINNLYGYSYGNRVIAALADHMRDVVKGSGDLFRGEGAMLLYTSQTMTIEQMVKLYNEQSSFAMQMLSIDGNRVSVRLSAGIVVADDPTVDVHAILAGLKYAQNRSETEKDGQPVILQNDYLAQNAKTLEMVASLRREVEDGCRNMELYYQPVLSTGGGSVLGCEAYLRWHRKDGHISPAQFMPWLENDASFVKLGDWILRRALSDGVRILEKKRDLILTVNLSHRQLGQPEFHQYLLSLLKKREFPGQNLCLELTDKCRFLDMDLLRHEIVFFKSCGVLVALDGSCLLDLHLVRELPVDTIKIGREFTARLRKNKKDYALLKALCQFAKESDILICAEGVEDEETLGIIREFGVDAYQGFVASGAVPVDQFVNLPALRKK
ncbi:MAG: EAL domain-containing protein [Lachnospiraceae bacterium]|nr:EAL domain-containing protein [Lachnospiraceae bacterium]